ncbi:MAG: threonine/serine exporter family protein [Planctomycetota bacterium]|jgi:uncharacterized membrane protein YjjP (DUF1212 family)
MISREDPIPTVPPAEPAQRGGGPVDAMASMPRMPTPTPTPAARSLLLELARALHAAGSPSDRTESMLEEAAVRCGVAGVFFVTPTSIMASFADGTQVIRGEPGAVDLGRMSDLEEIVSALGPTPEAVAAGERRLRVMAGSPPRYGRGVTRLSFAGASAAAAVLIGGTAEGALFAAAGAVAVGLGLEAAASRPRLARAFLLLASASVAFAATLFAAVAATDGAVIALAALIVLLPGLSLTLAMRELAARHLVSGGSRLMGAAVDFVSIGFGLALGERLARSVLEPLAAGRSWLSALPRPGTRDPAWDAAALLVAPLTFLVLFQAPPRAALPIIGTCLLAWTTAAAMDGVDPRLAPMAAAAAAGIAANLLSRVLRMPAAVFLVPGIMLLVPGVLGMRSLDAILGTDPVGGITTAVSTVLVGTAIAAGLLAANAALPPRGSA